MSAILVCEHNDPEVTRATVLHEIRHWMMYEAACPNMPKSQWGRCIYKGEHNEKFAEGMESLYRHNGVPLRIAQIVEGDYIETYPAHWRGKRWAG